MALKQVFLPLLGVIIFIALVGYFTGPVFRDKSPLFNRGKEAPKKTIKVNDVDIPVELANTDEKRRHGLSARDGLPEGSGMLFVFDNKGKPEFWMKDMKFAIDIIWIDDTKVVGVERNARPEPGVSDVDLARYIPPTTINYVLEVPAGFSEKNGIDVGSGVSFPSDLLK